MKFLAKLVTVIAFGALGTAMVAADDAIPAKYAADVVTLRGQVNDDHQTVMRLKAVAEKEKDVIRLNCLNDKLVQMRPLLNIFDQELGRLGGGATGADADAVFNELQGTAAKVREQRELAGQCGESKSLVVESSNTFDGPDVETPTDPYPDNDQPGMDIEPPAYASPDR